MSRSNLARLTTLAGVIGGFGLTGCTSSQPPEPGPDTGVCEQTSADATSLARFDELGGDYALVLTARSGEKSGETTHGELQLVASDSAGVPFYGWTDVQLDEIGAHRLGDPSSTARSAPGVLVLTSPDPASPGQVGSVTLRIGSQANRSDIVRFDGAYTALYVRWIQSDAFGGDWASGVAGPEAEGEFCAVRVASP
jgi:hypothetical protein